MKAWRGRRGGGAEPLRSGSSEGNAAGELGAGRKEGRDDRMGPSADLVCEPTSKDVQELCAEKPLSLRRRRGARAATTHHNLARERERVALLLGGRRAGGRHDDKLREQIRLVHATTRDSSSTPCAARHGQSCDI